MTAQAIAKFDKPMPCIRPPVEYIEFFSKHTRAAFNVAKVYSYFVFRAQRNRPGDQAARLEVVRKGGRWGQQAFWYLHTAKDLAHECSVTEDIVWGAIKILKRLQMIDARRGRHPINGEVIKYRGKSVLHTRLAVCQGANGLDRWPTVDEISQMRIVLVLAEAHTSVSAEAQTLVQDALEETQDAIEEKENTKAYKPSAEAESYIQAKNKQEPGETKVKNDVTPDEVVSEPGQPYKLKNKEKLKDFIERRLKKHPFVPNGDSPTSVCPNRDQLVARGFDIDDLYSLCARGSFLKSGWSTIPDPFCVPLLALHDTLMARRVTNTLPDVLGLFGQRPDNDMDGYNGWDWLDMHASSGGNLCHPNLPSLTGHVSRLLDWVDGYLEHLPYERLTFARVFDPDWQNSLHANVKGRWFAEIAVVFTDGDKARIVFDDGKVRFVPDEIAAAPEACAA
jgi:hypothetical protein